MSNASGSLHRSGISHERFERIIRAIERRLPKAQMFYIGRTNSLMDRRDGHVRKKVWEFDCMIRLDTFTSRAVCKAVEIELIRCFKEHPLCDNQRDGGGGWGSGEQHIYLMWAEC